MAPRVGLEPTTLRLTAECSAIELPRNIWPFDYGIIITTKKNVVNTFFSPLCNIIILTQYKVKGGR